MPVREPNESIFLVPYQSDVVRDHQSFGEVPPGLIDDDDGMGAWRDGSGDFQQMKVHGGGGSTRAAPTPRAGQMAPNI